MVESHCTNKFSWSCLARIFKTINSWKSRSLVSVSWVGIFQLELRISTWFFLLYPTIGSRYLSAGIILAFQFWLLIFMDPQGLNFCIHAAMKIQILEHKGYKRFSGYPHMYFQLTTSVLTSSSFLASGILFTFLCTHFIPITEGIFIIFFT